MSKNTGRFYDEYGNIFYPECQEKVCGPYRKYIDIEGDDDKFYPVLISASYTGAFGYRKLNISKPYDSSGSAPWPYAMTLSMLWTGANSSGHEDTNIKLLEYSDSSYQPCYNGFKLSADGLIIWLRGSGYGTVTYMLDSEFNDLLSVDVKYTTFVDSSNTEFRVRKEGGDFEVIAEDGTIGAIVNPDKDKRTIPTLNEVYPVGSIYTTMTNVIPSTIFGGSWTKIFDDYDYIYTGSQVICDSWSNNYATNKEVVACAYGQNLIDQVFMNRTTPPGYVKKVSCSAQISTGAGNYGEVYLNSVLMCSGSTWSSDMYKQIFSGGTYTYSQIGQETAYGYQNPGINLYVRNTGNDRCEIKNITVHGYFVSNLKKYVWRRTY